MQITLRPMKLADIPTLTTLWHDAWAEAHAEHVPAELLQHRTPDSFRKRLDTMRARTTVGLLDDRIGGFVSTRRSEVDQIFTAPFARGSGLAARLLGAAENALKSMGNFMITLDVLPENTRAIRFYEKHGWHQRGIEMDALDTLSGPFNMPVLKMEKIL